MANLTALAQGLTAITTQLTTANNPREKATVRVDTFSGKEDKDPVEWLKAFEQAATSNQWTNEARKVNLAGVHLKGAAADWFEGTKAAMNGNFTQNQNQHNNFV